MAIEFPFLPEGSIDRAADELIRKALGDNPPAPPVELDAIVFDHLAEREGLAFSDEADLSQAAADEILGMMLPRAGKILISKHVREQGPLGRYRFTVAHELGHWVLHRAFLLERETTIDLFGADPVPDRLVSLNRNVFPTGKGTLPREEWQANRFAAQLLAPPSALLSAFSERFGAPPLTADDIPDANVRSIGSLALYLARTRPPNFGNSLADLFQLSTQSMAIALRSRGYVSDNKSLL